MERGHDTKERILDTAQSLEVVTLGVVVDVAVIGLTVGGRS